MLIRGRSQNKIVLNETNLEKSVRQNIEMILSTKQGSVPMYREFGLPMEFVDRPVSIIEPMIVAEITEAIDKFEPRAKVLNVEIEEESPGRIIPIVEVEIINE